VGVGTCEEIEGTPRVSNGDDFLFRRDKIFENPHMALQIAFDQILSLVE